eukprot:GGOE01027279.1.p4 GENE.GGOE01027279.1~~GGOE01027279.1.p4  ORF type:complete len:111 (-),score=4.75 GGOE01027279.1:632-964(-)
MSPPQGWHWECLLVPIAKESAIWFLLSLPHRPAPLHPTVNPSKPHGHAQYGRLVPFVDGLPSTIHINFSYWQHHPFPFGFLLPSTLFAHMRVCIVPLPVLTLAIGPPPHT